MVSREKFTNILVHSNPVSSLVERMRNKKEKFANGDQESDNLASFIGFIGFIVAMYFVFSCNKGKNFGDYIGQFLAAFFCWPFYLLYVGISKNWCREIKPTSMIILEGNAPMGGLLGTDV